MGDIKNYSLVMEKGEEEDISEGELKDDDDDEDNNYIKYRFKSEFEEGELNEEKLYKHENLEGPYKLQKLNELDNIHLTKQVPGNIYINYLLKFSNHKS